MKSMLKIAVVSAVVTVGTALPAMAQIDTGIEFTTSVPFYAGNADMPAGLHKITQPDLNADMLLIRSTDGNYSAYEGFIPTLSEQPHEKSDVTFKKYGNVEYPNRISIEGETYGMKVDPTKAGLKAASTMTSRTTKSSVTDFKHTLHIMSSCASGE